MAVSLIRKDEEVYTCEATLLFDASVFSLECTSTAQPYRKALTHLVHGPQLAANAQLH
jgi:hypothetical protein